MKNTIISGKKAQNDVSIISGLLVFFILLGLVLPYIASAFDTPATAYNTGSLSSDVKAQTEQSTVSIWRVIFSVLTVFFWSFDVNIWVNIIILEPVRILAYIIIARNIWIGGGA